jgi:phosphoesterase RecJ-like protein
VAELTLHLRPRRAVDLMCRVLDTFEYHAGGRILTLHVDQAMLAATGATLSDTEHFTGFATGVDGVRFVVFLKERPDGSWRVSMRATPGGDVQAVAAAYDGGGHKLAAGCTLDGGLAELKAQLVADLTSQLSG